MENTIKSLAKSLVKAQSTISGAIMDSNNPFFGSKYADLESVTMAIKKPLAENGLGYVQRVHRENNFVGVETIIIHESGETFSNGVTWVPVTKNDAHGFGAGLTYARRYSLASCFGVIQTDDDGNGAIGNTTANAPVSKAKTNQGGPKYGNTKNEPTTAKKTDDVPVKRKPTPELTKQVIERWLAGELDVVQKANEFIEVDQTMMDEFYIATGVEWSLKTK
jgi:hypothetical protein